jgi:hypothetical protein
MIGSCHIETVCCPVAWCDAVKIVTHECVRLLPSSWAMAWHCNCGCLGSYATLLLTF